MIRRATIEDINAVCDMAADMHRESPRYRGVDFVRKDMISFLDMAFDNPDRAIFVSDVEGLLTGMIGCFVTPYMFNFTDKYAADFGYYVRPQFRGGPTASSLETAYVKWAMLEKNIRPDRITISESAGVDSDKVDAFLKKKGYNRVATIYAKES